MDALTSTLSSLLQLLKSSHPRRGEEGRQLTQDLFPLCYDLPDEQLDLSLSSLFSPESGILVFMKQVADLDEFSDALETSFKFLIAFLKRLEDRASSYSPDLRETALSVFSRARLGKVRMISLDLLLVLLDKKLPLGPQEKVQTLLDRCLSSALHETTKLSSGAKGSLYELLGKLAECYHMLAAAVEDRLVTLFLGVLKSQMDSKKGPDMPVIAGCLRGLTHYLHSFSKSVHEGSRYARDIYSYARKAADPQVPLSRYEVQKAGLGLLAQHGAQFRPFLVADYQATFSFMLQLLEHNNRDLKHDGLSALESFLYQISQHFLEASESDESSCKSLLMYFIKQFRTIMHDLTSSSKKVGVSVRGYGYFASACSHFLKPKEVETLVNEIVRRSDKMLVIQNDERASERVYQLPSFLEAFASIAKELGCVNQSFSTCLEQLIIMLFEYFPRIIPKHQKPAFTSLSRALLSLISSQSVLKKLLHNIIYQGLLFTCTHALPSQILPLEASQEPEDTGDLLLPARESTYQDFLPLWLNLIDPQQTRSVAALLLDFPNAEEMYRIIYDEVIYTILLILDKLDLSTETISTQDTKEGVTENLDDPSALRPKNPTDYQFFLNLVDFTGELLPSAQLAMFSHWVLPFGRKLIILSHTYPHVSGFFKLLTTCMSLCRRLDYFENEDRMETELETVHSDAFILFQKFLSELVSTLSQLKGEMLAASLHLILSFPLQIVERDFSSVIPAIKIAFQVGLSHLPLADTALNTLDEWLLNLHSDIILKHMPDILPALNDYLTTSADAGAESVSKERALIVSMSGSKRVSKMSVKKLRTADARSEARDLSSQLSKIRHRIVLFLGSLGGQTNSFLVRRGPSPLLISWDSSSHLKFLVPFQDIKPVIYLDPFLPRIIELALHSSDRQSKICACELLHAVTIYTIGYSATQPDSVKARSPQRRLYSHIFPAMIRLGCDVEEVSVQLFRPLTLQTIHWFTGNKTFESSDTIELLNAILGGLEDPSNSALREFSSVCVKEFLVWSIKQTTKKQQEQSASNAKSLLKRLYNMALHPNAFRRLGAALAFNKLYTVFREEETLVNVFTVEILVTYMYSLKQSHKDSLSLGIQTEIQKVVSHLERIIQAKRALFNQVSKERKTPKGLQTATLQGIVSFAFSHVGATETAFRETCMHLFYELSPLIPEIRTPADWVEAVEKGIGYFTIRFERGGSDMRGILKNSVLKGTQFSLRSVESWLESLTAAIDCYCWVFKRKLFSPTQLFKAKTEPDSMLFESIGFFCSSLAFTDILGSTKCFDSTPISSFTPKETEMYNQLRCTVVLKLLQLVSALLRNFSADLEAIPAGFWSQDLMKVVLVSVLCPSKLGFSPGNLTQASKLPLHTLQTCQVMMEHLPLESKNILIHTIEDTLSSTEYDLSQNISFKEDDVSTLITLLEGYVQLYNTGLYHQYKKSTSLFPDKIIELVVSLVTGRDDAAFVSLSPQQISLAGMLVDFAAKLGADKGEFLKNILNLNTRSEKTATGEIVYSLFSKQINQIILSDCHSHLSTLLHTPVASDGLVVLCLNNLLDYSIREKVDKRVDARVNNELVPAFLELWSDLSGWYGPKASQDSKTCFLTIFNKFTGLLSTNVFNEYPKSSCLLNSFTQLIGDQDTLPTFRSLCLSLVPFFLAACIGKQELRAKLKSALSEYVQNNFPLYSSELAVGSTAREEYIAAIDRMLAAVSSNSDTILMLEILLPVVCRQEKHIHSRAILRSFQDFIESASPLITMSALDLYYQVYADHSSYSETSRKTAALGYTIPMLSSASDTCFREFYSTRIVELMRILENKMCRQTDPHFQSQLVSKLCAFEFIEKLYSRLPCSDVSSLDSKLNSLYCNGDAKSGKELTQAATKLAHAAKSEDHRGDPFNVTRLQYHQSAYKLICSVITCTQTKMAFYSTFLFKEDVVKGSIMWENMINTEVKLTFSVLLDIPMERSRNLTTIRSNVKQETGDNTPSLSPPPRYMSSQYFSPSSSLVSDISQYDFSVTPSFFSFKKRIRNKIKPQSEGTYVVSEERLELDDINRNPCMSAILRVLDHMEHNKINPDPPSNPSSPSDLPQWMAQLHSKMTEAATHINVRLFIAKVVINRPILFQPYSKVWTEPLVQMIILQCNENSGMNYFIVDLSVTVLSWTQTYVFEDRFLASKLLEGLMSNTHVEHRSILRNNLSIVRTLVECWKDSLNIPYGVIYKFFSNRDVNGKMQRTGVQLMGIILANNIAPYMEIFVSENKFYESFLSCLENRLKEVYAPAAEVTGMLLNSVKVSKKFDLELLTKWTEEKMSGILSAQNQPGKFVECLYKIHTNFPEFCDRFLNRILFLLPTLKDEPRNYVIDIITSRSECVSDLKTQLKTKDFYSILRVKDSQTQVSAMKLALKIVPTMDEGEFSSLIDTLESIYPHTSPESREICYEFMMSLFDRKTDLETSTARDRAKSFLLRGLLDSSESNRLKVFAFWNDESHLPSETVQRLIQILSLLYSEATEDQFLSYSTNFFLELASRSPDYMLEMFNHPLAECKFQTQRLLDYSYSHRQSGFLPLFANTLPSLMASQSEGHSQEPQAMETESSGSGELRSTIQPIAFTATLDSSSQSGHKYNWLAPTLQSQTLFNPGTLDTDQSQDSSLLFTGFKVPRRMKQIGTPGTVTLSVDTSSHPVMQLKRRFVKGHEASTVFFQKQGMRKRQLREDYLKFQKVSRGNKVVMYRQYRTGDLPDIQIKHSELIRPLQALAQRDDKVARLLFSTLFTSIFSDLHKYLSGHEVDLTKKEVQETINGILKTTQRYSPPFIAAIMDISLKQDSSLHFYLEPTLVSTSCLVSCQQLAGIMVLENQLLQSGGGSDTSRSKRARGAMQAPNEETAVWIELGRLYRSIEDFDTLRGIFGSQIGTQEVTKKAIEAEETNDYLTAYKIYKNALESAEEGNTTQEEQDLWEQSLMSCLENLGKWKELESNILSSMSDTDNDLMQVWKDEYYVERHLPRLIKTKVKLLIAGSEDAAFDQFIHSSFQNDLYKTILETHYSEQLALYYLVKNNIDRAKHYVHHTVQNFAHVWSGLPDFQPYSKASKLQNLQILVEMSEFINFISDRENYLKTENLDRLLKRWHNRLPDRRMDPLSVWSDVITNRSFYLQTILEKYELSEEIDRVETQLTNQVLSSYLSIAEAASTQANFSLAAHFIKQVSQTDSPAHLQIRCAHVTADICLRRERGQLVSSAEDVSKLVSSLSQLQQTKTQFSATLSEDLLLSSRHHVVEGHQTKRIAELLQQPKGGHLIGSLFPESFEDLKSYLANPDLTAAEDPEHIARKLYLKSLAAYKLAVSDSTHVLKTNLEKGSPCVVDSMLAMAKFCDDCLRKEEEEDSVSTRLDLKLFPSVITNYILRAMQFGSVEARQLFPRLLQLIDTHPDIRDNFIKKSQFVPNWMFLQWLSQLVSVLDKPEGEAVLNILVSIATDYPQALYYPLKVSATQYKFPSTPDGNRLQRSVASLQARVDNPVLTMFCLALEQLTNPEMVWKDILESDLNAVMERTSDQRDKKALVTIWEDIKARLIQECQSSQTTGTEESSSLYGNTPKEWGQRYRAFSKEFGNKIIQTFGKGGEKLLKMNFKEFISNKNKLNELIKSSTEKLKGNSLLKEYSPWLANFQKEDYPKHIEVPGQYDGLSRPRPESHACIASFDPRILVLSSLRKPKRITVRADNEQEYKFLVKGGEDLRQDQRIEQLFGIMNQILDQDQACSQRNMRLRTYQVIPMTTRLGVLEWMDDTTTLKEFLKEASSEQDSKAMEEVLQTHISWVNKHGIYQTMYQKATRTQTIEEYNKKVGKIPWDMLRRSLYRISSCPEAFLVLRTHFIQSLSSLNICQYIIGIGDRHLSNFIVDLKTGRLIGIDFGHAFGSATQFLPYPELMPFRLTPQFASLMFPHKDSGLLRSCMQHALRALRESPELLLNTMDIFVKEPSLDWQQFARTQAKKQGQILIREDAYPKQKVDTARQKLMGYNSAYVMLTDLKLGHEKSPEFSALKTILLGDKRDNTRARVGEKCSSVNEQIACLIDHATDPNILGRTWQGWEPWM